MATYGTHGVTDLLAATSQSVAQFGEQRTFEAIQDTLDAHEALLREKIDGLVEITTDRQRRYGGQDLMTLADLDEFGNADTQKVTAGSTVGFPLRKKGRTLQWTRTYLENVTPAELGIQITSLTDADVRAVDLAIRRALFTPTNYTFTDRLVDNVDLAVKALVNADGAPLPVDPNGNVYDASTRTHYAGSATLTAAIINTVINNVLTFYTMGQPVLLINQAQEAGVRALNGAGEFIAAPVPGSIPGQNTTYAAGTSNGNLIFNRYIGIWGNSGTQVWLKPWIPAGYIFAYVQGGPKPLCMRIRNERTGRIQMVYEDEAHPLRCRSFERDFGLAVWNRANGSAALVTNATYTAPTLT
jgi:hypothetical protein